MSCFAYMPGLYTLDYWHEKYKGQEGHKRFLLTKLIEVVSFKWGGGPRVSPKSKTPPPFPVSKKPNGISDDPEICVVVPCYVGSEEDHLVLTRLQDALLGQYAMAEVILVDDASPFPVQARHGEQIIRLNRNRGPAAARNAGVKAALETGADIIAFTDMDCVPKNGWLSELCDYMKQKPQAHAASGNTRSLGNSWLDRYHNMNGTLNGRVYDGCSKLLYGTTCNFALSALAARAMLFNETFPLAAGEDIEFCYRLNGQGFNIHYVDRAVIAHDYFYKCRSAIERWKCFVRQFRKYSKGEKLLLQSVPEYYDYYAHSEGIPANV